MNQVNLVRCPRCRRMLQRVLKKIAEDNRALEALQVVTCTLGHGWRFRVLTYTDGIYRCYFDSMDLEPSYPGSWVFLEIPITAVV